MGLYKVLFFFVFFHQNIFGDYIVKLRSHSKFLKNNHSRFVFSNKNTLEIRKIYGKDILYIEKNTELKLFKTGNYRPNDSDFSEAWHLKNDGGYEPIGQKGIKGADVQIMKLWQQGIVGKSEVLVAVIDSGVEIEHPDLKKNIYENINEIAGNGIDDDHNGFVDDRFGYDFLNNQAHVIDENGHGTHVAGIIAAENNNHLGSLGISNKAKILPIKFINKDGKGDLKGAIASIQYAIKMGAKIINASWGGDPYSQALYDVIKEARDAGILFVAAAGNDGVNNDLLPVYPASYELENILSVGATDNADQLTSFSNFGKKTVHIAAPGLLIYSTHQSYYEKLSGTSMAAPMVSGAIALLWSEFLNLNFLDLKQRILDGCEPNYYLKKKIQCQGRLNIYNAFHKIKTEKDPEDSLLKKQSYLLESKHPYFPLTNDVYEIKIPNCQKLRLHFKKIETDGFDKIELLNLKKEVVETLKGEFEIYNSDFINGDTIYLKFTSDYSIEKFGFLVDYVEYLPK